MVCPAEAVFNPGELAAKAATIEEKAGELADATAEMAELGYTFGTTLPKFLLLSKELQFRFQENKNTYLDIAAMIGIDDINEFTPEKAKQFLIAYENYTPAITTVQLSSYKELISQIVENTCQVLEAGGAGVIAAGIRMTARGLCPTVKQHTEMLKDSLDEIKDAQLEIMETFADFARAKVSEMAATELSILIERSSTDKVLGQIAKQKGKVLFQIHKVVLINNACNMIKYMYFGEEQEYCKEFRKNSFLDVGKLIAFDYNKDISCPDAYTKRGEFRIPAMVRRGNETVPKGTLDLTRLLSTDAKENNMFFQIPNAKWLVDNGWIAGDQADKGPFFVKKLQIFPLPMIEASKTVPVSTELSILENKLGGENFLFGDEISSSSSFSYEENFVNCDQRYNDVSPYTIRNCEAVDNICRTSDGAFLSNIYPSLLALWNLKVAIPQGERSSMPYPVGPFHLKAKAEFCFRHSIHGKEEEEGKAGDDVCCGEIGKYSTVNEVCQACPQGSGPRLNGYYCESCPAGYEPRKPGYTSYGCLPCAVNTYKENDGNAPCKSCDEGTYTNGTVASSICISSGL